MVGDEPVMRLWEWRDATSRLAEVFEQTDGREITGYPPPSLPPFDAPTFRRGEFQAKLGLKPRAALRAGRR